MVTIQNNSKPLVSSLVPFQSKNGVSNTPATAVAGKNTMVRTAILFIAEESFSVASAIVFIVELPRSVASAMVFEEAARSRCTRASWRVRKLYICDS